MAKRIKRQPSPIQNSNTNSTPLSLEMARRSFKDTNDLKNVLAACAFDVLTGQTEVERARSASSFFGRYIQVMEFEFRVGANPKARQAIDLAAVAGRPIPLEPPKP